MSAKAFNRWQAAGTHLLICIAIAATVIAVMLGVWYPGPLFEAAGGTGMLYILVGVDVILGPLLTLIVFKSGKRGMKFDLTAIGLVQVAALIYGAHIVYLARPAFIARAASSIPADSSGRTGSRTCLFPRWPVASMPSGWSRRSRR